MYTATDNAMAEAVSAPAYITWDNQYKEKENKQSEKNCWTTGKLIDYFE